MHNINIFVKNQVYEQYNNNVELYVFLLYLQKYFFLKAAHISTIQTDFVCVNQHTVYDMGVDSGKQAAASQKTCAHILIFSK